MRPTPWSRPLPYDLQRHITTKFLSKQERHQYFVDKFNSTSGREEFKKNISSLPPDTRVKLFVNGIYNKFNNLINTYLRPIDMSQLTMPRCGQIIQIRSYSYQIIRINLDTIYYGYHLARSKSNETPSFTMNGSNLYLQNIDIKYCPTEGHTELTEDIRVEDFELVTRILFNRLKSPSKKFTEARNKIIYDFALIVEILATKYTKLKEQAKKDKLAAKEKAKNDRLAAKEKAKNDRLAAKEKAQKDKLAAKEKAQKDKLAAKEKAQKDKLVAKEQSKLEKANQKKELCEMRIQEREMKKCRQIIM